jgi:hypothetical protein
MLSISNMHVRSSVCAGDWHVDDFALTPAEQALVQALNRRSARFLVIGMGAAVLEGAPFATQDIDLWFDVGTAKR